MKKILSLIIFCLFLIICGCSIKDGDGHLAKNNMLTLFNYIEENENEKIKELFALEIKEDAQLDEEINEMCDFVNGEYKLITNLGLGTSVSYEYGEEVRTFNIACVSNIWII